MIQNELQEWLMRDTQKASHLQIANLPIGMASDIILRSENQDRMAVLMMEVSSKRSFIVGILCDGMGGMSSGADCASLAIAEFIDTCIHCCSLDSKTILHQATENAHTAVHKKYKGYGGTTLSAFLFDNTGNFEAVNVGDSRIYIVLNNKLEQVSTDDTVEGMLGEPGLGNYLLQHIGMKDEMVSHMLNLSKPGNVSKIILTSDGAHFLDHKVIQRLLLQNEVSVTLAKRLVDISKWCGGQDNASALVFADTDLLMLPTEHIEAGLSQVWDISGTVQLTKDGIC